jgi:hypothetical protein
MILYSRLGRSFHFRIRRASLSLLTLAALGWSSPVFGSEIHDAAKDGDLLKVQALLKSNPDLVSSKDGLGMTALHWAASKGRKEVAAFLVANKANVNAKNNNGQTPLHDAAFSGQRDVAELLLVNKADVNAKDNYGWTPLHAAADNGHKDVAELLLANKAGVNAQNDIGWTSLHYAAQGGYKDVVDLLLANKADVNAKNRDGETPLHWAVSQHHEDVAKLLRQHGGHDGGTAGTQKAFLAGAISIGGDISTIETKSFTCTPLFPLKKGDKVAAMLSDEQAWSVDKLPLQVGTIQVAYPILAMLKSADAFHAIFPAVLKTKAEIKVGETLRADGYRIEAKRAFRAGESIPVLRVGDSFLSVEAGAGLKDKGKEEPLFAAYKEDTTISEVVALVEAWRIENKHVRK